MRKFLLALAIIFLTLLSLFIAQAQTAQISTREAEWRSFASPTGDFIRHLDASGTVLFRVPVTWKQEAQDRGKEDGSAYKFSGPNAAVLQVSAEKIPDGLPLADYVSAITRQLRDLPGSSDSLVVRREEIGGLEAREIMFELQDANGNLTRRIIWCAVDGPTAVAFVLVEPEDHIAEIEPLFRAVVDSLMTGDKEKYASFEALRSTAIKESKPARIDEVQSIVKVVNGLDPQGRTAAIARLAAILAGAPDTAIDLFLDRRPLVRAATLEAIGQSRNHSLDPFLLQGLRDRDVFVAGRAAIAVAALPDVVDSLRKESFRWIDDSMIGRVWPYLNTRARVEILSEVFGVRGPIAQGQTRTPAADSAAVGNASTKLRLLPLLIDIPVSEFKLPLTQILMAEDLTLTAGALQMALDRRENLPAVELLKLLSSASAEGQRLAARNLGESGTTANIVQLEDFAKRLSAPANVAHPMPAAPNTRNDEQKKRLAEELATSIKKIRLRDQLREASAESRSQLLKVALADTQLVDWVWASYVRDNQSKPSGSDSIRSNTEVAPILPLGENAFPQRVTHYVAVPQPAELFRKLGDSLNSIQMDSARAQANLVLVLNGLRAQWAQQFGAPLDKSVFEYAGINLTAPIAMSTWTAKGAPLGIPSAQRRAIIARVADRDRFERSLALYQKSPGSFASLPDYVSVGARFLGVLPEILPMSAELLMKDQPEVKKELPLVNYGFSGKTELDGYVVQFITQRRISAVGTITNDSAYWLYLGDVALLAPDLVSLEDVLQRLRNRDDVLSGNSNFKTAVATGGEAIYLSSLDDLFGIPVVKTGPAISERGALRISNTSWESSYHLTFDESDWVKPLAGLEPGELLAPRDLLPRSTVVYYFMKLDGMAVWKDWSKELFDADSTKVFTSAWAGDFSQEILPELGPECGIALLDMPDLANEQWQIPVVIFFKLKSDKLKRAFDDGNLLKEKSDLRGFVKVQLGSTVVFITIKNGFMVAANSEKVFALLDQKEKLASSPDFAKAAKRTPAGVVAFGGYNLEATSVLRNQSADSVKAQQANLVLSLTKAFHSPSLSATAKRGSVDASLSVSMDREGRYSIAELQSMAANPEMTFAVLEPSGVPILNQNRIKNLGVRIHAKAEGEIERIAEDVASGYQSVDQRTGQELRLKVLPRRAEPKERIELPVTAPAFAPFLQSTKEIPANEKSVMEQARKIAGTDRDAWSVARKLSQWIYKNLTWKRVDYADATQTLATREADCYEFSKLYVAMARSLGLPARVVSGLAYSGSAFGGHAWVEVYVGSWIELDPTWGTDFVDATHVRDSSGALLTYAALNLVQLEVLEAPRTVEDFQLDATALTKKLREDLPLGRTEALSAALDMGVLTDELMGAGTWAAMTDDERGKISASYPRVISEVSSWLTKTEGSEDELRLLTVKVEGNSANALLIHSTEDNEILVRFHLVRRDNAWLLTDMVQTDNGLRVISEILLPSIGEIRDRRNGKKASTSRQTDFVRILISMSRDPQAAISLADSLLKDDAGNRPLRFLKSLALTHAQKADEAVKLWAELSEEPQPLPVAVLKLAGHYADSKEDADKKKAVALYLRYLALEPSDSRAHTALAVLYEGTADTTAAEKEYRAAIECDNTTTNVYMGLAEFYSAGKRFKEAVAVLDEAAKRTGTKDDLFAILIMDFSADDEADVPEGLAASEPQRMARSALANLNLARIRIDHDHAREALPLLRRAAALDRKASDPYEAMAEAHRELQEWTAALNAADSAIRLNADNGNAHFYRACALAQLGRANEALASLKKAVELNDYLSAMLEDEADLKPLAAMPGFKALLPAKTKP